MADFTNILRKLSEDYQNVLKEDKPDSYSRLSTIFEELGKALREYIQATTVEDIKKIIKKLKGSDPLTSQDKDLIRLWIVGDADYYLQMENNYADWKVELQRLAGEIVRFDGKNMDLVAASKMRGLFRDGSRVLADIFYFLEQKDRVEKFIDSTAEIDPEERSILARLLDQKLCSPDF